MAAITFASTLVDKIKRSADTSSYRFTRPPEYSFRAGQWFTITIPSPAGPLDHHFSHAESPTEPLIELTTRLTGSEFKNTLDSLLVGTEVEISGPYGAFTFRGELPRIAFLTGGIGVTPVRSMIRYLLDTDGEGRGSDQELVMFYGSMTQDGIVYLNDFTRFEQEIPRFRVVHVITNPGPTWKGHGGFITADTVKAELEDPSLWTYYVVGPPPMIGAMQKVMDDLGIPKDQRVIESFAGYTS